MDIKAVEHKPSWMQLHKHPCIDCGKPCGPYSLRCPSCAQKNRRNLERPTDIESKSAEELGLKGKHRFYLYPCIDCGKERWVPFSQGKPTRLRCYSCATKNKWKLGQLPRPKGGEESPAWKGGRYKMSQGYIMVRVHPDDFFFPMTVRSKHGYTRRVLEHRLVMAKHLGRCLLPWEVVHHKGTKYPQGSIENRGDNRLENLELLPSKKHHLVDTVTQKHIAILEKRVTLLEAENITLREQPADTAMLRRSSN